MKLLGYIDGIEVKFDFYLPNKWKATIPKKITGKYILQLKAVDEAGNETNFSDLFICIDFQNMKVQILGKKYDFREKCEEYLCIKLDGTQEIANISNNYIYNEIKPEFAHRLVIM